MPRKLILVLFEKRIGVKQSNLVNVYVYTASTITAEAYSGFHFGGEGEHLYAVGLLAGPRAEPGTGNFRRF